MRMKSTLASFAVAAVAFAQSPTRPKITISKHDRQVLMEMEDVFKGMNDGKYTEEKNYVVKVGCSGKYFRILYDVDLNSILVNTGEMLAACTTKETKKPIEVSISSFGLLNAAWRKARDATLKCKSDGHGQFTCTEPKVETRPFMHATASLK